MFSMERSARDRGVDTMIVGASVRFDILEYSRQETANPDPVQALSRWLKDLEKESLVIGKDHIEKFFEPSGERPAFYVRVQSYKTNRATYALTWVDCNLAIHIIVPEPENRSLWARYIGLSSNMITSPAIYQKVSGKSHREAGRKFTLCVCLGENRNVFHGTECER